MDRRGHGESEAGSNYSLRKEAEDIGAVVNSRSGPVFVLGHSIGGVFALEAAFLTDKISKLVLYEPPLQDLDHTAVADRMEKMIQAGEREQALMTFLREHRDDLAGRNSGDETSGIMAQSRLWH